MDELEVIVFISSIALAGWAIYKTFIVQYHPLFFSWNPGLGFVRLSVWLGFLFAANTVIRFSASDIVTNIVYIIFYLVMAYAVIKVSGQLDPIYRVSYRVDVLERRNSMAGFYLGARTLAIGLIFSGSIVGEGPGFYVVIGFFGMGWLALELAVYLLCKIRNWNLKKTILRESDIARTSIIAAWYISVALILRIACAGDFIGWGIGLRDFTVKSLPILILFIYSMFKLNYKQEVFFTLLYGALFLLRFPK